MEGAADSESWGRAGVEGRQTADNNQYGNRWEWQRRAAAGDESIDAHNNHWSHDVHPPNHHLRERKVETLLMLHYYIMHILLYYFYTSLHLLLPTRPRGTGPSSMSRPSTMTTSGQAKSHRHRSSSPPATRTV